MSFLSKRKQQAIEGVYNLRNRRDPESEYVFYAKKDFSSRIFRNATSAETAYGLFQRLCNLGIYFENGTGLIKRRLIELKKDIEEDKKDKEKAQESVNAEFIMLGLAFANAVRSRQIEYDTDEILLDEKERAQTWEKFMQLAFRTHDNLGESGKRNDAMKLLDQYIKLMRNQEDYDE